ncbi:unnamed protein product [Lactuca saligna]|uniref:Uncharacterized protein n=1 Tax=Lactuca saligna TaxID=75948 RepID=A0AA35VDZ4_LACSI|nr:unnamed protein product [Lactuca saligna]
MTQTPSPTLQYKQHVTRRGAVSHEIPTPVSLQSKKRRDKDMANHISKKQKKRKKQRKLVLHDNSADEDVVPEMPVIEHMVHSSSVRDSPVQSNFEETGNLGGNVETYTVYTTINHGEQSKQSTPEQTTVIPPKVSNT